MNTSGYPDSEYLSEGIAERSAAVFTHPYWLALKGWICGLVGRREEALAVLQEVTEIARKSYVSPGTLALLHHGLDDLESFRKSIRASFEQREDSCCFCS